ncbi:GILT-like protein 1 isoform X2 [Condylostylus longicornis]|uniref:GILT-like protein 1 isoform X2 n=1 Tax=Condylostylus longicornis TaxID=2530218 RepID=UPI00244DD7F2|nr:GILT-like protein 1 isoform X2 [Condylostylus longicornis]
MFNFFLLIFSSVLNITVLYETLCGDSRAFFRNQLPDAYPALKNYIDIQFVPFGKANSFHNGVDYQFACHFGPVECYGNKLQSCMINTFDRNADIHYEFTKCYMTSKSPRSEGEAHDLAYECARAIGLPKERMDSCMNSREGILLQLRDEQATKSLQNPLQFVPTIVYDGVYDKALQDQSLTNFRGVICQLLLAKGVNDNFIQRIC